jgi:hypothetical protein
MPVETCRLECLEFKFEVDAALANAFSLMKGNLDLAGKILSRELGGAGCIDVLVRAGNPPTDYEDAIAWTDGPEEWFPTNTTGVWEPGTVYEARTGTDLNGGAPDIIIEVNPAKLTKDTWFDPSGADTNPAVPAGKVDFVSTVMHEIVHGLGFTGYRITTPGESWGTFSPFSGGKKSTFDALTDFDQENGFWADVGSNPPPLADILYFSGNHAVAEYGGPVPLNSSPKGVANFYHLGNSGGEGKDLVTDLMGRHSALASGRTYPSDLDVAMLRDLGWAPPKQVSDRAVFQKPDLRVWPPLDPRPWDAQWFDTRINRTATNARSDTTPQRVAAIDYVLSATIAAPRRSA